MQQQINSKRELSMKAWNSNINCAFGFLFSMAFVYVLGLVTVLFIYLFMLEIRFSSSSSSSSFGHRIRPMCLRLIRAYYQCVCLWNGAECAFYLKS